MNNCINCKWKENMCKWPCDDCVKGDKWEENVFTNADCIRAMVDEELMEWMADHVDCGKACPAFHLCRRTPMEGMSCEGWILKWLKMEVEE